MYCRKCGNSIEETDLTCKACGTPASDDPPEIKAGASAAAAPARAEEEGEKPIRHTEFTWNVYDFPKPKKTEDLHLIWDIEKAEKEAAEENRRKQEEWKEAASTQQTSDSKAEIPEEMQDVQDAAAVADAAKEGGEGAEEKLRPAGKAAEAEAAREESVKEIEKFFTFTKKNEEFQQLLDREYEKLKNRREGEPYIEPEVSLSEPEEIKPDLCEAESDFERMILEGTTPVEEAAPIEDLLHRRTIPVDLLKIQLAAKKAARQQGLEEIEKENGRLANRSDAVKTPDEAEIPAIELSRKSAEDIIGQSGTGTTDSDLDGSQNEAGYAQPGGAEGRSGGEASEGGRPDQTELEASAEPAVYLKELSEMAAARDSFLKQLEEERRALKLAEEEAAKRAKLAEELRLVHSQRTNDIGTQSPDGMNTEIQVTVAVKSGNAVTAKESVRILHSSAQSAKNIFSPELPENINGPSAEKEAQTQKGGNSQAAAVSFQQAGQNPELRMIDAEALEVKEEPRRASLDEEAFPAPGEGDSIRLSSKEREEDKTAASPAQIVPDITGGGSRTQKEENAGGTIAGMEEGWHENTLNSLLSFDTHQLEELNGRSRTERRGGGAGKIILIIIAVILTAEIAALGIKYLAPDSAAAQAVQVVQIQFVKIFDGAVDGVKHFFSSLTGGQKPEPGGEGGDGEISAPPEGDGENGGSGEDVMVQGGSVKTEPDPLPMADKEALIATQLSRNKNIKEITAAPDLKYVEGGKYGSNDISRSQPIQNNIWETMETGETKYYDQAIVGTLIAFDSQWQDYVNSGTKDVLSLLSEGSRAYKLASTFSEVGKVTQSFEVLQIGEIRQGDNGFYVWTKEQIKKTEKGQTKTVTYDWIYQLKPENGEMKIVNYTSYKM